MNSSYYQNQINRLEKDIADLQKKIADENKKEIDKNICPECAAKDKQKQNFKTQ